MAGTIGDHLHRSIAVLEAAGYACCRSAASLGCWDNDADLEWLEWFREQAEDDEVTNACFGLEGRGVRDEQGEGQNRRVSSSSNDGLRNDGRRLDFVQVALQASTLLISQAGELNTIARAIGPSYLSPKRQFRLSNPQSDVNIAAYRE